MLFPPNRKKDQRIKRDQALIPLINVIFLMLVFFLVVGRIEATREDQLDIPQSQIGQAITGKPVVMELLRDGAIMLGGKEVQREGLYASLQLVFLADRDNPLTIKADRYLPADYLLSALQLIRRAGGRNVTLVTQS